MTRSPKQRAADDAALVASGEPMLVLAELARLLDVSGRMLRSLVQRRGGPEIRYLSTARPVLYCVADVRAAVEGARQEIDERRDRAAEKERVERAAKLAARPHVPGGAPAPQAPLPVAPSPRPSAGGPEIIVRRSRGGRFGQG